MPRPQTWVFIGGAEGNRTPDLLDAKDRHSGRLGLFPHVVSHRRPHWGGVGRGRCCTSLQYGSTSRGGRGTGLGASERTSERTCSCADRVAVIVLDSH
jgi:hypothetical protein